MTRKDNRMLKLKYGVVSTASIVPRFINALNESGTGEVIAIASRTLEKAEEKAREWNIAKSYGNYNEMFSDEEIDVIYVATINSEHYTYALAALQHGKHVVCEKPFTLKKAEAEHLFKVAKENNLFIVEAQKVVFLPVMKDIKNIIASGKLGKIHLIDMTSSSGSGYNQWLHSLENGGGSLYGNASYGIHLLRYLFDCDYDDYMAFCTKGSSSIDEQCVLNLRLKNDILAVSKISTNIDAINKAYIYGENGYIEIENYWKARSAIVYYNDKEPEVINYPCEYELVYEVSHFNECILSGQLQSPIMNENMTVHSVEMLENIQNSWKK